MRKKDKYLIISTFDNKYEILELKHSNDKAIKYICGDDRVYYPMNPKKVFNTQEEANSYLRNYMKQRKI